MEKELIREYASRMAKVFADRVDLAKRQRQAQDHLKPLEDKRDFWAKIAQLPLDSEHWESIRSYMKLMSQPRVPKPQLRALYKTLQITLNSSNPNS